MHHSLNHHRHHPWGSWGRFSQPQINLVDVNQQAIAIATNGGTAIAINITYIYYVC